MEVTLIADQDAFIRYAVETGRLRHAEEAATVALALCYKRERQRAAALMAVDETEASLLLPDGKAPSFPMGGKIIAHHSDQSTLCRTNFQAVSRAG